MSRRPSLPQMSRRPSLSRPDAMGLTPFRGLSSPLSRVQQTDGGQNQASRQSNMRAIFPHLPAARVLSAPPSAFGATPRADMGTSTPYSTTSSMDEGPPSLSATDTDPPLNSSNGTGSTNMSQPLQQAQGLGPAPQPQQIVAAEQQELLQQQQPTRCSSHATTSSASAAAGTAGQAPTMSDLYLPSRVPNIETQQVQPSGQTADTGQASAASASARAAPSGQAEPARRAVPSRRLQSAGGGKQTYYQDVYQPVKRAGMEQAARAVQPAQQMQQPAAAGGAPLDALQGCQAGSWAASPSQSMGKPAEPAQALAASADGGPDSTARLGSQPESTGAHARTPSARQEHSAAEQASQPVHASLPSQSQPGQSAEGLGVVFQPEVPSWPVRYQKKNAQQQQQQQQQQQSQIEASADAHHGQPNSSQHSDTTGLPAQPDVTSANLQAPQLQQRQQHLRQQQVPEQLQQPQDRPMPERSRPGIQPLINNATSVDRRMYEQVVASRRRISERLSTANQHNAHLRSSIATRQAEVASTHSLLQQLAGEFGSLKRRAQGSAASAYYGMDKEQAAAQMMALAERIASMQQVLQDQAESIHEQVVRSVPVAWYGVASNVQLKGSFDAWTQGITLSAEDIGDSVFTKFQASLQLLPGDYRVKFLVDGEWRLASDWPTAIDSEGSENLVLSVD
ncbi:hypothetical protein WJX74_009247 [Apatococcus lobatus]|uniref:AMP-activated protein kinase glycogen-binding domain-containing protein n=1 Tax=Apatococcus lobatus TaxID=904363 RepID=A0AAW1QIY2_9CHLO